MRHPLHRRRRRLLAALLVGLGLALWPRRVHAGPADAPAVRRPWWPRRLSERSVNDAG